MKTLRIKLTLVCVNLIIVSLMFSGISSAVIDPATVVALWLFEDPSELGKDSSDNGNHGTIAGAPQSVAGKFGLAVSLNGSDDYIEVPDSPSLDITSAITIVAWVNWTEFKDAGIISKSGDGDGTYFLSTGCGGGATQAKFGVISTAGHTCGPASAELNTGEWYHVAGVFDGSQLRVYINGSLENAEDHAGEITTSDGPIIIGSYAGTGYKSNVIIEELGVFNTALTEDDIQQIMATGLAGTITAVSPKDKLSSTWAKLKVQ